MSLILTAAACLCTVHCTMLQSLTQVYILCRWGTHYYMVVPLLPVNLKCLACDIPDRTSWDLALLTRLTQLKQLKLRCELTQPLPKLPALSSLRVCTSDLQNLSSVTATVQELDLTASHSIDFKQPTTLAHFTCMHTLSITATMIRNFIPKVLPPTLGSIKIRFRATPPARSRFEPLPHLAAQSADHQKICFPAGGHLVKDGRPGRYEWTRHCTPHSRHQDGDW